MTTLVHDEAEAIARELFHTPEGRADPYPRYRALRSLAPVHRSDAVHAWVLTRYDDCNAVLRDPRLVRGYVQSMDVRRPSWRERPSLERNERSMLMLDGPAHTRQRKLVAKAFTPRTVDRMRPRIEGMVNELLDDLADAGGGDLMSGLAFPLPVRVIGELLGVPETDRPQFRELFRRLVAVFEVGATEEELDAADEASVDIDSYFLDLVAALRARPGDDLLSALVAVDDGGDRLSDAELVSMASLLFVAGFETTTNLIGNGTIALLARPDQLELLRAKPDLFANLADELLRYDGTVQITTRITSEPIEVGGVVIGAGEPLFTVLGAANHDPARYGNPDQLDVTRTDIRPLTFGGGVHFCVGAALARAEIEIVFHQLLERFGDIELDGLVPMRDRLTLRGPAALPLAFGRRSRSRAVAADAATPLPVRPAGSADTEWRAFFRQHLEAADATPDDAELAARVALLGRVPLFGACRAGELEQLAATAYPISFDTGDVLCAAGADADECYVIAAGTASVTMGDQIVATVGADDVVGERGPLLGVTRAATVTATSHVIAYAISRERLSALGERRPELADAMRDQVRRRYG